MSAPGNANDLAHIRILEKFADQHCVRKTYHGVIESQDATTFVFSAPDVMAPADLVDLVCTILRVGLPLL